jgi:fibronectin-binding autotransporter adhesin
LGTTTTAAGVITNLGTIQITGGSGNNTVVNLSSNTTLQGSGGILTLYSGDNNGHAVIQSSSGFTLLNATNTIQGYGVIGNGVMSMINGSAGTLLANVSGQTLVVNGSGVLTNNGTMQANSGATLQVSSNLSNLTSSGGPVLSGGTFVMNNGTIQLLPLGTGGGELVSNLNTIILNGPNARLTDASNANAYSRIVSNFGSLTVQGGNNSSISPGLGITIFNNYGFLNVGPDSSLSIAGASFGQDEGGVTQVDGQLSATQLSMDVATVLRGTGQVYSQVTNLSSTVVPGDNGAPGTLTINGSFSQPYSVSVVPSAALSILLGSVSSSLLQVNGSAVLNGTLRVASYNGFTPAGGQTFDILHYTGSLSGTFGALDVSGLNLTAGQTASVDYSHAGKVVLRINGAIPATPAPSSLLLTLTGLALLGAAHSAWRSRDATGKE